MFTLFEFLLWHISEGIYFEKRRMKSVRERPYQDYIRDLVKFFHVRRTHEDWILTAERQPPQVVHESEEQITLWWGL